MPCNHCATPPPPTPSHTQAQLHQDELYPHACHAQELLAWPRRWRLILREIRHYKPQVLCLQVRRSVGVLGRRVGVLGRRRGSSQSCQVGLADACPPPPGGHPQEVDRWEEVRAALGDLGYEGSYVQRSGGRPDGCATLW